MKVKGIVEGWRLTTTRTIKNCSNNNCISIVHIA